MVGRHAVALLLLLLVMMSGGEVVHVGVAVGQIHGHVVVVVAVAVYLARTRRTIASVEHSLLPGLILMMNECKCVAKDK